MSRRLTTEEFIHKCKHTHGDKYMYEKTMYVNSHTKVIVTCVKHGDFEIIAHSHANGNNCYKCYEEARNKRIIPPVKHTKDEFIHLCSKIHNNKFSYDNIIYENLNSVITLICPYHGEILVGAGIHLAGHDCAKCSNELQSSRQTISIIDNIEHFNKIHNEKYSYDLVDTTRNYKSHEKIEIICPIHGVFTQQLSVHKTGCGCQKCGNANSGNLLKKYNISDSGTNPGVFYKIIFTHKELNFRFLKIGITCRGIKERYRNYKEYNMEIIDIVETTNLQSAILEDDFKKSTNLKKFKFPENIKFSGWTECYELGD